jgi:ABC-type sugar transport system substrate-binding protein
VELAAKLTADFMAAHPDLAGLAGFDSNSGPGMALSVKEGGKVGRIKLTTVDAEPEHLQLVKDGVIDYLVGQKRELFTALGAQFSSTCGTRRFRFPATMPAPAWCRCRARLLPAP